MRIGIRKRGQFHKRKRVVDAGVLLLQHTARLKPGGDVLPDRGPGKQRGILKDEDARWIRSGDHLTIDQNASIGWLLKPRDKTQQRRLSASRWAEQRHEISGCHAEIDGIEYGK